MDIQQRIYQQRVRHIIDSYMLMGTGNETDGFDAYVNELLHQYPTGLIELALVETLSKHWLTVPMQRGIAFLTSVHEQIKQWQVHLGSEQVTVGLTPSQFSQITGLDAQLAFAALISPNDSPTALPTQAAID